MIAAGLRLPQRRSASLADGFAQRLPGREHRPRIVYLGGLGELGDNLSEHLASRREVERRWHATGVPVTVLRAAMIIGSGSASFEILRYLVEHLPRDGDAALGAHRVSADRDPQRRALPRRSASPSADKTIGRTIDIGGPEVDPPTRS